MTLILIIALSFLVIASFGLLLTGNGGSQAVVKRVGAIAASSEARAKSARPQVRTPEERRKAIMDNLKEAERKQRRQQLSLSARMRHAGLEPNVKTFTLYSSILGVVVFGLVLFFYHQHALMRIAVSAGAGFAMGYGLPRWVLSFMAKGRMKKFTAEFADAMDILVRGLKSGLPVNDGLKVIAKEMGAPLGPEFQKLIENVQVGMTLDGALDKMVDRMPVNELKFFAIVIAIQAKTGGNLAEALGNLSAVLRSRRMMGEKIKALSSEAIASASIIGSLPPAVGIMIAVVRPSYMAIMFSDSRGQMMLLIGVTWMVLGILSMRKMINFKF